MPISSATSASRPPLEGRQRLETIAENTQLGAGYSIAMRDLEIRGAGDILGTRQHGHIAAVGFHLYTRLLAEAVRRLRRQQELISKGEAPKLELSAMAEADLAETSQPGLVSVDVPLPVNIPSEYVPDKSMRAAALPAYCEPAQPDGMSMRCRRNLPTASARCLRRWATSLPGKGEAAG